MTKNISIIACVSSDGGLGSGNDLLWHIPADMRFFRKITSGHTVVMGSNTFRSIGSPLPNRRNIVLSRREVNDADVEVCHSEDELRELLEKIDDEIFIIGGASLYRMFLPDAAKIFLTEVQAIRPADVFFPEFSRNEFERKVLQSGEVDGAKFETIEYSRRIK